MTDWKVGDLGAFDHNSEPCAICSAELAKDENIPFGHDEIMVVLAIYPPSGDETHPGLRFATDLPGEGSCACGYRKVVRDKHEACEPEFVALVKRSKQLVPNPGYPDTGKE
jgi:hypothetical protein